MYISKIMIGQTVKTGDNYEKIEVEGTLSPSDNYDACKKELQAAVDAHFGSSSKPTPVKKAAEVVEAEAKPSRTRSRRQPKEEEAAEPEAKEEKKPAARRRKAASNPKKNANTAYDRTNKEHKAEISKMLDDEFEGWSDDDGIKVGIKAASTELNGTDFLGADGNLLPDFVGKFCDLIEKNAE